MFLTNLEYMDLDTLFLAPGLSLTSRLHKVLLTSSSSLSIRSPFSSMMLPLKFRERTHRSDPKNTYKTFTKLVSSLLNERLISQMPLRAISSSGDSPLLL